MWIVGIQLQIFQQIRIIYTDLYSFILAEGESCMKEDKDSTGYDLGGIPSPTLEHCCSRCLGLYNCVGVVWSSKDKGAPERIADMCYPKARLNISDTEYTFLSVVERNCIKGNLRTFC